jgi:monoamine oxidase
MMDRYDLIVIGGGFTGVTAAVELDAHRRVLLLEGSSRLGGRCRSIATDDGRGGVDVGAHFFGRDHRRVRELVRRLGLQSEVIDYVPSFGPDPTAVCDFHEKRVVTRVSDTYFNVQGIDARAPWAEQAKFLTALLTMSALCATVDGRRPEASLFARELDATTYAAFVDRFELPSWFADLMVAGVEGVWSQRSDRMSLLYFLWYLKNNGGFSRIFNDQEGGPQQYGLRCGMHGLLERYAQTFTGTVKLNAPVRAVRVVEDRAADVIVAVTPHIASKIAFTPELPEARRLLHAQPMGYAIKAVMFYDEPWWHAAAETNAQMYAYLSRPGHDGIDWILATSPPDGSYYALTVFVMPSVVDRVRGQGKAAIEAAIAGAVVELTRDPRARAFSKMELCDWRDEPFVGGGPNTTFEPGVLSKVGEVFNRPDFGRLYFASSEYATSYTGYVEGALAAGQLVARQIVSGAKAKPEGCGIAWATLAAQAALLPLCFGAVRALRVVDALRAWGGGLGRKGMQPG